MSGRRQLGAVGALAAALVVGLGCGGGATGNATTTVPLAPNGEDAIAARHPGPCSIAAKPLPRAASRAPLLIGISANLRSAGERGRCRTLTEIRHGGIAAVREDLDWAQVEPTPGTYHWARYDRLVGIVAQRGLVLLPLLTAPPAWAGPGPHAVARDPAAFARFTAAAVARYGPGGTYWASHPLLADRAPRYFELYNEPYGTPGGQGGPTPGAYARNVIAAVNAGRAANPRVRYLLAADYITAGTSRSWLDDIYQTIPALRAYVAGVAVHPYSDRPLMQLLPGSAGRSDLRRVEAMRAILVRHGDGALPMWLTEIGWSTCTAASPCVNEAAQAGDLAGVLQLARTRWRSFVRAVFVYKLHDYGPSGPIEQRFGILRPNGTAKPAWRVLQEISRVDTPLGW
jgi:polysaccharide biosynthesis protein PslG